MKIMRLTNFLLMLMIFLLIVTGCSKPITSSRSYEAIEKDIKRIDLSEYHAPLKSVGDYKNAFRHQCMNFLTIDDIMINDDYDFGNECLYVRHSQIQMSSDNLKDFINEPYIWVTDTDLLDVEDHYQDIDLTLEIKKLYQTLNIQSKYSLEKQVEILMKLSEEYGHLYDVNGKTVPHAFFKDEKVNGKAFTEIARLLLQEAKIKAYIDNLIYKKSLQVGLNIEGYWTNVEKIIQNKENIVKYINLVEDDFKKLGYKDAAEQVESYLIKFDGKYYSASCDYNNEKIEEDVIPVVIERVEEYNSEDQDI